MEHWPHAFAIVGIAVVIGLYHGWRAYLHHKYPIDRDYKDI